MTNKQEIFFNASLNWWETSWAARGLKILVFLLILSFYSLVLLPKYPIDESVYLISEMGIGLYLLSLSLVIQLISLAAHSVKLLQNNAKSVRYSLAIIAFIGFIPALLASLSTLLIPLVILVYMAFSKMTVFQGKPDILAIIEPTKLSIPNKGFMTTVDDLNSIEVSETFFGDRRFIFKLSNNEEISLILAQEFSIEATLKEKYPGLITRPPTAEDLV